MKATDFEYRHQTLLRLAAISISFLTYLIDRVDIVWALVQGQTEAILLERIAFAIATLLIGCGAALRTWSHAQTWSTESDSRPGSPTESHSQLAHYAPHIGSFLYAIGLGFLAPVPGFIFLIVAETILASRLILRETAADRATSREPTLGARISSTWHNAIRLESGKWALFLTMLVFTSLLNDRIAEILGVGCFLLAALLNYKSYCWAA